MVQLLNKDQEIICSLGKVQRKPEPILLKNFVIADEEKPLPALVKTPARLEVFHLRLHLHNIPIVICRNLKRKTNNPYLALTAHQRMLDVVRARHQTK